MNGNFIAIIDTETTGLYPTSHDRIIEVAALLMSEAGEVVDQYETLLNPNRDLGPTHIHGIRAEFARMGINSPWHPAVVDTYRLTQLPLAIACDQFGVITDGQYHSAMGDVMATAGLLSALVAEGDLDIQSHRAPIMPPDIVPLHTPTVSRSKAAVRVNHTSGFLSTLAERVVYAIESTDVLKLDYFRLLGRVLEDRVLEEQEAAYLRAFADDHQLSQVQIRQFHIEFLTGIAVSAWSDGILTDHELIDLNRVCRLLDLDSNVLESVLSDVMAEPRHDQSQLTNTTEDLAATSVCFTGTILSTVQGEVITRAYAKRLAEQAGLVPKTGVSKGLDLLVIADPDSMSGKAKKAREYGVRIIAEREFWGMIAVVVN